jgi:minor extracellular serine protease Vpr
MQFLSLKFLLVLLLTVNMSFVLAQSNKTIRLMKSAKQDMELCNYKSAILCLDKIIDHEEMNLEALYLRGICKDSLKIYSQALIDYDKVISFSNNIEVYKNRAMVRMKLGKQRQAVYDFDIYLEKYSNDVNAFYYRSKLNAELFNYKGAFDDESRALALDSSFAFLLHNKIDTPLNGNGVVVGIIDGGFDYTNPIFYDTAYSELRIARAWIQNETGNPPLGYNYGTELKDTVSLLQRKYDYDNSGSHGTSVSSVAAGSGIGGSSIIFERGIAYDSELVLVSSPRTYQDWRELNMSTIIDGINYIFSYAQSVNKPAVINISMGSLLGARDGESLFAKACDDLTGPGKILVFCAMNEGGSKKHIGKAFTSTDTVLNTLIPIDIYNNGERRNYIDVWGDSLETFSLQFGMYSKGILNQNSMVFNIADSIQEFYLIGSDHDTCYITLMTKQREYNMKSHATIDIYSKTNDTLALSIYAKSTNVHLWQDYFDESWLPSYGSFLGNNTWATEGDDSYTIGEMGCTKSAITVGASVSREYYLEPNYYYSNERRGNLASYSSKGPTMSNMIKPDITAPVGMIFCATNSFDPMLQSGLPIEPFIVSQFTSPKNGRVYSYMAVQGTSFASPMVAGIIALMLQVSPNLNPEEIKAILTRTSIKDIHTTQIPETAKWGAGKINANAAIKETIQLAGGVEIINNEDEISVFQNPNNGGITLMHDTKNSGYLSVDIFDSTGKTVLTKIWQLSKGMNQIELNLLNNEKGTYNILITGQGGQIKKKFSIH